MDLILCEGVIPCLRLLKNRVHEPLDRLNAPLGEPADHVRPPAVVTNLDDLVAPVSASWHRRVHAVGQVECTWGEAGPEVRVIPEAPWWTADRPLTGRFVLAEDGGVDVTIRVEREPAE